MMPSQSLSFDPSADFPDNVTNLIAYFQDSFPIQRKIYKGIDAEMHWRNTINLTRLMGLLSLLSMQLHIKHVHERARDRLAYPEQEIKVAAFITQALEQVAEYGSNCDEVIQQMQALSGHIENPTPEKQQHFLQRVNALVSKMTLWQSNRATCLFASLASQAHEQLRADNVVLGTSWTNFEQNADLTLTVRLKILDLRWLHLCRKNPKITYDWDFYRKAYRLLSPAEAQIFRADPNYAYAGKWIQFEIEAKLDESQLDFFNRKGIPPYSQSDLTSRHVTLYNKLDPEQQALYRSDAYFRDQYPWIAFVNACEDNYASLRNLQLNAIDEFIYSTQGNFTSAQIRQFMLTTFNARGKPILSEEQFAYFNQSFPDVSSPLLRISEVKSTLYPAQPSTTPPTATAMELDSHAEGSHLLPARPGPRISGNPAAS